MIYAYLGSKRDLVERNVAQAKGRLRPAASAEASPCASPTPCPRASSTSVLDPAQSPPAPSLYRAARPNPHRIFEAGKVAFHNPLENYGRIDSSEDCLPASPMAPPITTKRRVMSRLSVFFSEGVFHRPRPRIPRFYPGPSSQGHLQGRTYRHSSARVHAPRPRGLEHRDALRRRGDRPGILARLTGGRPHGTQLTDRKKLESQLGA